MSRFHSLEVIDIQKQTPWAISITLKVPEHLQQDFKFSSGQYLTFKHSQNQEEIRRSYSICSSPKCKELSVVVKQIENGVFSTYALNQLKVGDVLQASNPEGTFIYQESIEENKNYVGIAAGSGITPIFSIAQSVLDSNKNNKFILIYGNQSPEHTIFFKQIEELQAKYPEQFFVYYTFSKTQVPNCLFGRIEKSTLNYVLKNKHANLEIEKFFLCGPEDMILNASQTLKDNGTEEENIKFELFTSSTSSNQTNNLGEGDVQISVLVDGEETIFTAPKKTTLLNAVLKQGVDAPYSCKGGICSSCICKVVKGNATMTSNMILSDEEVANGLILSCQAYASSDQISIDYDNV